MDLLDMVEQTTWREMLVELIASEKMSPWDVDLCAVADKYLARVKQMQALDLRVPANVILASALLLRFKAESIRFEDDEPETGEIAAPQLIDEPLPSLVYNPSAPRARRVSLKELMDAVEQVMRDGKRVIRFQGAMPGLIELELPKQDLHERIKAVFQKANALKDSENMLLFSALVAESRKELNGRASELSNAEIFLSQFIPVLHLVQENKLQAWQESLYGEIFLKIVEETEAAGEQQADSTEKQGKQAAVAAATN